KRALAQNAFDLVADQCEGTHDAEAVTLRRLRLGHGPSGAGAGRSSSSGNLRDGNAMDHSRTSGPDARYAIEPTNRNSCGHLLKMPRISARTTMYMSDRSFCRYIPFWLR